MLGDITNALYNLPLHDLLKCKKILAGAIDAAYAKHKEEVLAADVEHYVEYNNNFIPPDSVEFAQLEAELELLKIKGKKSETNTSWLTTTNQPYTWKNQRGKEFVNNPVDITQSKYINQLMLDLNKKHDLDLNSCLVTYYKDGKSAIRLHNDGEDSMDSTQPICVVSVGAVRQIDFLHQYQHFEEEPMLSLNPESGSLYLMNVGCQQIYRHRVKADHSIKEDRYSLSFRRRIVPGEKGAPNIANITKSTSLKSNSSTNLLSKSNNQSDNNTSISDINSHRIKRRTSVLFGTSITSTVIGKRLGHGGRQCINVSRSGAKIGDISDMVDDFKFNNPAACDVEKVIFSFGTNDVKYKHKGIGNFRQPIIELIEKTNRYFPGCIIYIQCVLPIGVIQSYTAANVLAFNDILRDICRTTFCFYVDCFWDFVSHDGMDHNKDLYRDWLHLNKWGVGLLCGWLKYIINNDSLNPIIQRI